MDHHGKIFTEKISLHTDKFTPSDHLIADYLLRTYPVGFLQNASELAKELKINVSTVTRFFSQNRLPKHQGSHGRFAAGYPIFNQLAAGPF